ncbi:hypothetical protein [Escherichia coli]|uniref:hypothetical protein n=1 Tax=Escherichia coli TaxID=562 RepID=UPI0038908EA4
MNDCPRRYTQKKAAYRSVSPGLRKKPLRRVFAFEGRKMNDCPRRYTQKKAAYRSVSPGLRKKPLRRVFAFGGAER